MGTELILGMEEVINYLKELEAENKKLKEQNECLQRQIESVCKANDELKEENKELKEKLEKVKEILQTETLSTAVENRFYKILNEEESSEEDSDEEEEKCEECGKCLEGEDKCGKGCPAYDKGWNETHETYLCYRNSSVAYKLP